MINYEIIGRRITETRKLRRITQALLAERANLSESFISHIENANKKASLQSLVDIAGAMNITVDSLLCGNQPSRRDDYRCDVLLLIEDCTGYEKRIIMEQIISLKESLRNNQCLI